MNSPLAPVRRGVNDGRPPLPFKGTVEAEAEPPPSIGPVGFGDHTGFVQTDGGWSKYARFTDDGETTSPRNTTKSRGSREHKETIGLPRQDSSDAGFSMLHYRASELLDIEFSDKRDVLGLPRSKINDIYHIVLTMPAYQFYSYVVASYLGIIFVFAVLLTATEPVVCIDGVRRPSFLCSCCVL